VFAYLQSTAIGGYRVATINSIMQACAAMLRAAVTML